MTAIPKSTKNSHVHSGFRTPNAERIFFDRYAMKNPNRFEMSEGDLVVFTRNPNAEYRTREIGRIIENKGRTAKVVLRDDKDSPVFEVNIDHIDYPSETTYNDMASRVAHAIGANEDEDAERYTTLFSHMLKKKEFVPGGRILAGAGAPGNLTFYNCYVVPIEEDSRSGIISTVHKQFEIMSRGGGVGINLSILRPRYDYVKGVNGRSSGAVLWGNLYSLMTNMIEQGGSRRGALMLIMDIWHPDIEIFINSKKKKGFLDFANISVGITDTFMEAVAGDKYWDLCFPDRDEPDYDSSWRGDMHLWKKMGKKVKVYKTVKARKLFNQICTSAWASAEPGLFFVDRVNAMSNSYYYEHINCCNPCGEQPLPPFGVCNLGALNLASFVIDNNTSGFYQGNKEQNWLSRFDWKRLKEVTALAVRFLDNVIDVTPYFLRENERQQLGERRVGLGIMGLAETLLRVGLRYGDFESIAMTKAIFVSIRDTAYETSSEIAQEKGSFPMYEEAAFLESGFAKTLPESVRVNIKKHGIRNVTLLTVAPTGTTGSMTATSTGIEPYFMFQYEQRGHLGAHIVEEPVIQEYRKAMKLSSRDELPAHFVTTEQLSVDDHIVIQAAAQEFVDSAISKTSNLPSDYTIKDVEKFYRKLYDMGCKGGTVYRDGSRDEQCLVKVNKDESKDAKTKEIIRPLAGQPRPGLTHSLMTHLGRVHVTLNTDPETGELFDVFICLSKAGSDIAADTDALGRMISLILRMNSEIPTRKRLGIVIEQLEGIACSSCVGFGPNRVRSVPDGVARCLKILSTHLNEIGEEKEGICPDFKKNLKVKSDIRKSSYVETCPECKCASAVRADGCFKCPCGFSIC